MGFKCNNCLFQNSSFLLSLPPASPLCGLTELLDIRSVLFVIELQYLVIRVTKVQLVVQPKTCSLSVVWCSVSVSSTVLMNSSLFSLLLCLAAGQRAGLGNTFKLKIAQRGKVLKEHTLQITEWAVQLPALLLCWRLRRASGWVWNGCWRVFQQKPRAGYDLVTLCRSLKMVNNISL